MEVARSGLWAPRIEQCLHHQTKGNNNTFRNIKKHPSYPLGSPFKKPKTQYQKILVLFICLYNIRTHTAVKIAPRYSEPTVHVLDASKSVVVVREQLFFTHFIKDYNVKGARVERNFPFLPLARAFRVYVRQIPPVSFKYLLCRIFHVVLPYLI